MGSGCSKTCNMTLNDLRTKFNSDLNSIYPEEEINSLFQLLVRHRLGLSSADIALQHDLKVRSDDLYFFLAAISELKQEKPVQYILGSTEFYGLPFKVSKDVLIPRPETEELVDWVLTDIVVSKDESKERIELNILDIGTGSGCIAIALAKSLPNSRVYALDLSDKALEIAKHNAILNNVSVLFLQQDILNLERITDSKMDSLHFDIIVSNPPYVRELEKQKINKNVIDYEPHLALFVKDDNPLQFYDKIAEIAKKQLSKKGILFLEVNQYLGENTKELLKKKGFSNIELRKDLYSNDRMIKASIG